jgi:hypothetical protein
MKVNICYLSCDCCIHCPTTIGPCVVLHFCYMRETSHLRCLLHDLRHVVCLSVDRLAYSDIQIHSSHTFCSNRIVCLLCHLISSLCLFEAGNSDSCFDVCNLHHSDDFLDFNGIQHYMIDASGYWWPPTYFNWLLVFVFVQHVLLYCFVIVGSTLLGLSEAPHILQVDTGFLSPNPTSLFCMFSCQHILMYFQGHFGALNIIFLARHSQNVDGVKSLMEKCVSL